MVKLHYARMLQNVKAYSLLNIIDYKQVKYFKQES